MKMKKLLALIVAVLMLFASLSTVLMASAVTLNEEELKIKPGTTHSSNPEYSLAWIDKLIVRDDATAITASKLIPKPDYPYDVTFEEFISDANGYAILNELNEDSLNESFELAIKALYYIVAAMGMTDNIEEMYNFVSDKGIRVPSELTAADKMKLAVVYAAIKYDAVYVLYDRKVTFVRGTTLDGAAAIILSELGDFSIPSSVNSVSGLSLYFVKDFVESNGDIPLSDNPSIDELFYWVRAITSAKQGYQVPLIMYEEATQSQLDYVDYAYYATIFDTLYDIEMNPLALAVADSQGDTYAIPRLILTTMLDESGVDYDKDAACENLFGLACENGWFEIDEEFYSDIYDYEIYVPNDCEKLWFTPFSLADQIGGELKYVNIKLDGKNVASAATNYAKLDSSKNKQTVKLEVTYDDNQRAKEEVTYTFKVIRTANKMSGDNETDLLSKVESAIESAIPSDNEKALEILSGVKEQVSGIIDGGISQIEEVVTAAEQQYKGLLTTYASDETTKDYTASDSVDLFGKEVFENLVGATYGEGGATYISADSNGDNTSVMSKAVEAIKENPEIVAAPTSFVTIAGLAGFLFTRKRKNENAVSKEDNTDEI